MTDVRKQELADLTLSPPDGITVALADESNLFLWKVNMDGPSDSPYAVSSLPDLLTDIDMVEQRSSGETHL